MPARKQKRSGRVTVERAEGPEIPAAQTPQAEESLRKTVVTLAVYYVD